MRPLLYFAYGSNLDADQMAERCPRSRPLFPARLDDYRLGFTHYSRRWSGAAADIVEHPGAQVWGMAYELTPTDLDLLDHYEAGYDRITLDIFSADATAHDAISYTVRAKLDSLEPSEIYLNKMLNWSERWNFPEEYRALMACARGRR
ncbi:MAG: gamma-glutamylcyclotransferase [bacterium]|nr:gamma-glutamylcyclotransferase [bacterium]